MANPIKLWKHMTPEEKRRINMPNANVVVMLHSCYTGETIDKKITDEYFTETRHSAPGPDIEATVPLEDELRDACLSTDLTQTCRKLRKNLKTRKDDAQKYINEDKAAIKNLYSHIILIIRNVHTESMHAETIENTQLRIENYKTKITTLFDDLYDTFYYKPIMDPVYGNAEYHKLFEMLLDTTFMNNVLSTVSTYIFLNIGNSRIKYHETLEDINHNLSIISDACTNLYKEYERIEQKYINNIPNTYKKSNKVPSQKFEGPTEEDLLSHWGISINILDNSFLEDVFKFYCYVNNYDFVELKKIIKTYSNTGVFLRKGSELYKFFHWCFTHCTLNCEKSIELLDFLSQDFHIKTADIYEIYTEDIVTFLSHVKTTILEVLDIPSEEFKNIKFGYLSFGCNNYKGDKTLMETYEHESSGPNSPEPEGGGAARSNAGGAKRATKYASKRATRNKRAIRKLKKSQKKL